MCGQFSEEKYSFHHVVIAKTKYCILEENQKTEMMISCLMLLVCDNKHFEI